MIRSLLVILMALISSSALSAEIPAIDKTRTVLIHGAIGGGNILPLGLKLVEYATADKTKPVSILVNSPGGEVTTGYLFINYMEQVRAQGVTINCYVQSMAASMAFQILLHCDNRYTVSNAVLLWHPAKVQLMQTLGRGEATTLAEELAVINDFIYADLTANFPGISTEDLEKHFRQETLHLAVNLSALTNGKFITVVNSIPGLLNITPTSVPSNAENSARRRGRIYYIYE